MKKALIISHYYPPEMGAASNRIFHLANGLKDEFEVTVLTPLPNYPEGRIFKDYRGKLKEYSKDNGVEVKRLWIFPSNSSNQMIRLLSMLSYSVSLIIYFLFNSIPKKVIIQSPPLLVAFTSVFFLRSKNRKLVLNVSDLWPDAALDLGAMKKGVTYNVLKRIEAFNYRHSQLILGQSKEILRHIEEISKTPELLLYRNYPKIKGSNLVINSTKSSGNLKMVYAGLLGFAQGIVSLCEHLNFDGIELHVFGSGPEAKNLEGFIEKHPEVPLFYHGSLTREKLHEEITNYDVAIIPLIKRIYGSVPSKIFELAALGIPVLYFGGGEGEQLVSENRLGWVVQPKDYDGLNKIIQRDIRHTIHTVDRSSIMTTSKSKFSHFKQIQALIKVLNQ